MDGQATSVGSCGAAPGCGAAVPALSLLGSVLARLGEALAALWTHQPGRVEEAMRAAVGQIHRVLAAAHRFDDTIAVTERVPAACITRALGHALAQPVAALKLVLCTASDMTPLQQLPVLAWLDVLVDCVEDLPTVREHAGGAASERVDTLLWRLAGRGERLAELLGSGIWAHPSRRSAPNCQAAFAPVLRQLMYDALLARPGARVLMGWRERGGQPCVEIWSGVPEFASAEESPHLLLARRQAAVAGIRIDEAVAGATLAVRRVMSGRRTVDAVRMV